MTLGLPQSATNAALSSPMKIHDVPTWRRNAGGSFPFRIGM